MKKYSSEKLNELIDRAKSSSRRRSHLNIHSTEADPIQRLFIALEPDTYITPHFHPEPEKWEIFTLLKRSCLAVTYKDNGKILDHFIIDKENPLIEFPPLTWHSIICLEPETLVFEVKKGPYRPLDDKCFAKWAPKEGDPDCIQFIEKIKKELNVR